MGHGAQGRRAGDFALPLGGTARAWCGALSALMLFAASPSRAEPDAFGLGDGHHGARVVSQRDTILNAWTPLVEGVDAGSLSVRLASTLGFAAGDLVLLLQGGLEEPPPDSGSAAPFDVDATGLGRFELARVASTTGGGLDLTAPLVASFPALLTQAVAVREYSELTVLDGGSVVARPWDGASGGVIALLVSGALRNDGAISADGRGYRGGAWVLGHTGYDCDGLDEPWPGGAAKGEGPALAAYGAAHTGAGNVLSGGGGGLCTSAGGGGGGHVGAGGRGGHATLGGGGPGGRGGAPLRYSPVERLVMGGGGGGGHNPDNRAAEPGANGGGIVFVRAAEALGAGQISAKGAANGVTVDGQGQGGGGAGGFCLLRVRGRAECGLLSAAGGGGGFRSDIYGGGGGGAGGRIVAQAADLNACPTSVAAGVAGLGGVGATPAGPFSPGHFGEVTVVPGGFEGLATPTVLWPRAGDTVARTPRVSGSAPPGANVTLLVDGAPAATSASEADGGFALTPAEALGVGERRLEVSASRDGVSSQRSEPVLVVVTGDPDAPTSAAPTAGLRTLAVGCGCTTSESARALPPWWLIALVAVGRGRAFTEGRCARRRRATRESAGAARR